MSEEKKLRERRGGRKATICADVREQLVKRFPLAFMPNGSPKIALKIGIANDVIAQCPDIPREHIKLFFGDYAGGSAYQLALIEGSHRFGLDGMIAGEITEEHKERARQIMARHQAQTDARRQGQHG